MPRPSAQILAIFDAAVGDSPAEGPSAVPGLSPRNGIGSPKYPHPRGNESAQPLIMWDGRGLSIKQSEPAEMRIPTKQPSEKRKGEGGRTSCGRIS